MSAANRWLAYLAAAALCVPVGLAGLRIWQALTGSLTPEGPAGADPAPIARNLAAAAAPPIERIAEWNLFGRAAAPAAAAPAAPVEAPKTRLQLTLRGVAASPTTDDARAIIADPSGRERHYRPGEPVPGGASLAEVHPDRVLLLRNGRYETLPLAKLEGGPGGEAGAGMLGPAFARQRFQPSAPPVPPPEVPELPEVPEMPAPGADADGAPP
jgi:general secretion pathway protein C